MTIVYRRGQDKMSASGHEQDHAVQTGVRIIHNAAPVRVIGNGKAEAVEFAYTEDAPGGLKLSSETFTLKADQVFKAIGHVLGLYSNIAISWIMAVVADLVINKPLGWSPKHVEFKRAHLYDINPVGMGAMLVATLLSVIAYAGALGPVARAYAPFIALATAMAVSPLLAWATRGRYYQARLPAQLWKPGEAVRCSVCENRFESEDMAHCPAYGAPICSLCCTLESRCHDRCKTDARAADQVRQLLAAVLPRRLSEAVNFRVAHYVVVVVSLIVLLAVILAVVYEQQGALQPGASERLAQPFLQAFALLSLVAAVGAWWIVLGSESRQMAEDESNRQNLLLTREIKWRDMPDILLRSGQLTGMLAPMIAISIVMQQVFGLLGAADAVAAFVAWFGNSQTVVLLVCMGIVMAAGCILESLPVTVIFAL